MRVSEGSPDGGTGAGQEASSSGRQHAAWAAAPGCGRLDPVRGEQTTDARGGFSGAA